MINLLTSAVFTAETPYGDVMCTLPELLYTLVNDTVSVLRELRPHQSDAVYMFLVQLVALCADWNDWSANEIESKTVEDWEEALYVLGGENEHAWELVSTTYTVDRPIFLQPGIPEKKIDTLEHVADTPDAIDILVTAKNHDVKLEMAVGASVEEWVYALITMQTMSGYSGKGNFGIVRMNGGLGSRLCAYCAKDTAWSSRFIRDITILLTENDPQWEAVGFSHKSNGLTYLCMWDGKTSLPLAGQHPFFIECSRRIRLFQRDNGSLYAVYGSSDVPFVQVKGGMDKWTGVCGDPWGMTSVQENKALTVSAQGITYKLIANIFSGEYVFGLLNQPRKGDTMMCFSVLVRGQGKTEGFHTRVVPIPPKVLARLSERDRIAKLMQSNIALVEKTQKALAVTLRGYFEPRWDRNSKDPKVSGLVAAWEKQVDTLFLPAMWDIVAADSSESQEKMENAWHTRLRHTARACADDVFQTYSVTVRNQYKSITEANVRFNFQMKEIFGAK